jgi:hypothetical protein
MTDPIRIAIGTDPQQRIACETLKSSIRRRTARPVEFFVSWCPQTGWHPLMQATPKLKKGTAFSKWRWLLPDLFPDGGRAIYLDADQVCLTDIAELFDWPLGDNTKALVKNAVGIFGKKRQPEPGKNQTSVMLLDFSHASVRWNPTVLINQVLSGIRSYPDLMQGDWFDPEKTLELPPEWNHFGIHTPDTKILHWSHVKSQPYRNPQHPTAWVFERELRAAVESGDISPALIRSEVSQRHIDPHWLKVIP